jgi:hypothetical protein
VLTLAVDVEDPLDRGDMDWIRAVVHTYGDRSATTLRDLAYETAPMIEANAGGDRGDLLDLNRARRHKQYAALKERLRSRRRALPPQTDDPGVGEVLKAEFQEIRDDIRRANTTSLGDG